MPAHRAPRFDNLDDLKAAVVEACLDRLYEAARALHGEEAFRWTAVQCREFYEEAQPPPVPAAVREEYRRVFAIYAGLRANLAALEALAAEYDAHPLHLMNDAFRLLGVMRDALLPVDRFGDLFSPETAQRWAVLAEDEALTRRKAFILDTDRPTKEGTFDAWGFGRAATDGELACMALAAGDFPLLHLKKIHDDGTEEGDTVPDVIRRMTTIMRTDRERLWVEITGGRFRGPNDPARGGA